MTRPAESIYWFDADLVVTGPQALPERRTIAAATKVGVPPWTSPTAPPSASAVHRRWGSQMKAVVARTNKRLAVIVVAGALVVIGGGAAYAYWTSTGVGSGTATTGTSVEFVVASSAATGGPLTPGGPSQTVGFTVANPGTGSQQLSSVVVTVANADGTTWNSVTGCSASDYTIGTPVVSYGEIAPSGITSGTVTITMDDDPVDQDGCKLALVPLYFVAS